MCMHLWNESQNRNKKTSIFAQNCDVIKQNESELANIDF